MPLRIFLTCTLVLATILPVAGLNNRPVKLSDLQALIERGDSVSVYDWQAKKILYTSSSLDDIAALKTAITIETAEGGFRCACVPELEIRLSRKNKEVGMILVYPDGLTIGYEPWSSDARIQDKEKWLTWFDTRKIPGPRQEVEADEARDKNAQADEQRWMSAMPASLRPIWPKLVDQMMPGQALDTTSLNQALAKEFPERPKRIRALILLVRRRSRPMVGLPDVRECCRGDAARILDS